MNGFVSAVNLLNRFRPLWNGSCDIMLSGKAGEIGPGGCSGVDFLKILGNIDGSDFCSEFIGVIVDSDMLTGLFMAWNSF